MERTTERDRVEGEKAYAAVAAKLGMSADVRVGGDAKQLHAQRKVARQLVNKIMESSADRAQTAEETLAVDHAATMIGRIGGLLDVVEQTENAKGAGDDWRDENGKAIQVLDKGERFAEKRQKGEGFSFGNFLRGMVNAGPRGPEIKNALAEGTDSAGGFLTPELLTRELIDRMRDRQVCVQAGARTVMLESDKTRMVRVASDPVVAWRLENSAVTESEPVFEAVTFVPRTLAVLVKVSVELLQDAVNMSEALATVFAGAMATELDRVALAGTGVAPMPLGLLNQAIPYQTMGVNGAQFGSLAGISQFKPLLVTRKTLDGLGTAEPSAMIMHPATAMYLDQMVDTTGQPLIPPASVAKIPRLMTNSMPTNETVGTSNNCTSVVMGDFRELLLGVRSNMRIQVLQERFMDNLQVGFVVWLRADVQVARQQAFCKLIGIKPSA